MSNPAKDQHSDRPALPRDAFRAQRLIPVGTAEPAPKPLIVTPEYEDRAHAPISTLGSSQGEPAPPVAPRPLPRATKAKAEASRNPFDGYGERSSSRPYALRLPDPIDLVVRQIAAEERTHPLRVIDRILHDHLKRIGRLPPPRGD